MNEKNERNTSEHIYVTDYRVFSPKIYFSTSQTMINVFQCFFQC